MNLFFNHQEIRNRIRGLTFDDVLLIPQKSDVRSRRDPQLETQLSREIKMQIPIVSANMDTITGEEMAVAMDKVGGVGILHRFMTIDEQALIVSRLKEKGLKTIAASIGVNEDYKERAEKLIDRGAHLITVDIAHGHSILMLEVVEWLKNKFPHIQVIAGNIATPTAAKELISAGADALKVGIGPGSMCTTRIITGCGVPQLTAIALCAEVGDQHNVPIIADGGIRTSGDIVKALAAGASSVMLGSLLAGTIETPGEIKKGRKSYRGMASKSAQISWRGGVPEGMAAEGESTQVAVKGYVKNVILEITGGIRSGMSYVNATAIDEIKKNAYFVELSPSGMSESHAHGLK